MVIIVVNCTSRYQTQPSHSGKGPSRSVRITPALWKQQSSGLAPNPTAYLDNDGRHPGGDEEGVEASEDVPVDDEDGGEEAEDATGHEDAGHAAHESPQGAGMHRHPTLKTNKLSERIRALCN